MTASRSLTVQADSTNVVSESNENNNTGTGSVTIIGANPDLTVTSVTPAASSYNAGKTVKITSVVKNQGNAAAGTFVVKFTPQGMSSQTQTITGLAAGASQTLTWTFVAPTLTATASRSLTVQADSTNVVSESNESNNTGTGSVTIIGENPDLTVTALTADASAYKPGERVTITATVKNNGIIACPASKLRLAGDGMTAQTKDVSALTAGGTQTVSFTFTAPQIVGEVTYNITATADPDNKIVESNEGNNSRGGSFKVSNPLPDLTITQIRSDKNEYDEGATGTVTVTVKNQGAQSVSKLYPEAKISIQGFEHSALPDGFFDVAVGNVPFGAYSLPDPKYDRYHFRIHDYFFAKTLDKVRPGGIVVFVTSKGTLDKQDSSVRRYIAQRAELLGTIRLPNTAFRANAGTEVTTDILFLQKRERPIEVEPDWVHVGQNEEGVPVNRYFLDHPDMLLGHMAYDKSMYGNEKETTCEALPDANLTEQLAAAIRGIRGSYEEQAIDEQSPDESRIPADPTVPNFSFAVRDGRVYFRRDHWMERCDLSAMDDKRVRGMIHLRDLTRELIQAQLAGAPDAAIHELQAELNERYDSFTRQYDLLSSRRNASVFGDDDGYYLLSSLEILDDEHKVYRQPPA